MVDCIYGPLLQLPCGDFYTMYGYNIHRREVCPLSSAVKIVMYMAIPFNIDSIQMPESYANSQGAHSKKAGGDALG